MSNRAELHRAIGDATKTLAKAERRLHLGQDVRSAHLYAEAVRALDEITEHANAAIANADRLVP